MLHNINSYLLRHKKNIVIVSIRFHKANIKLGKTVLTVVLIIW